MHIHLLIHRTQVMQNETKATLFSAEEEKKNNNKERREEKCREYKQHLTQH